MRKKGKFSKVSEVRPKYSGQEIAAITSCGVAILVSLCILIFLGVSHFNNSRQDVPYVTESQETLGEITPLDTAPPETEELTDPSEQFDNSTTPPATTPQETEPEVTGPDPGDPSTWTIQLTEDEIYELATAIYLEGRGESSEGQKGIGSVILSRMITRNDTLHDVLFEYTGGFYQFSVAPYISSSSPDDKSLASAMELVIYGPSLPTCVTYFRADYYHNWSRLVLPYCQIDRTCFSHDIRLCEEEGGCMYEQEE